MGAIVHIDNLITPWKFTPIHARKICGKHAGYSDVNRLMRLGMIPTVYVPTFRTSCIDLAAPIYKNEELTEFITLPHVPLEIYVLLRSDPAAEDMEYNFVAWFPKMPSSDELVRIIRYKSWEGSWNRVYESLRQGDEVEFRKEYYRIEKSEFGKPMHLPYLNKNHEK